MNNQIHAEAPKEVSNTASREGTGSVLRNEAIRLTQKASELNRLADAIEFLPKEEAAILHEILFGRIKGR